MSSVTRFIRQVDNSNHFLSAATVVATPSTYAYILVADAGNVVGNYAPGVMQHDSALNTAILQNDAFAGANASTTILRDMGKTVKAPVGSATGPVGYFRQVQLLNPAVGVLGDATNKFITFYVPIVIDGVCSVPAACGALHPVNGQM